MSGITKKSWFFHKFLIFQLRSNSRVGIVRLSVHLFITMQFKSILTQVSSSIKIKHQNHASKSSILPPHQPPPQALFISSICNPKSKSQKTSFFSFVTSKHQALVFSITYLANMQKKSLGSKNGQGVSGFAQEHFISSSAENSFQVIKEKKLSIFHNFGVREQKL